MLPGEAVTCIGLDARCLNRPRLRGMGKYVQELVRRLPNHLPVRWELLADRPDLPFHHPGENVGVHVFDCRGHRFHAWEQWALPRQATRLGVHLLHCPGTRVPWWQPRPTVVTLHDALPWLQDESEWPAGWYRDRLLPRAFARCAALLTDSECSRRDIAQVWPDLGDRVRVIPLGVGDEYFSPLQGGLADALAARGVRRPYLLYIGGIIPRKRLDWALRVLETLADARVRLVVCGLEAGEDAQVFARARPDLHARLHVLPFLAETDMAALYRGATAVLYPTLYEGFGFPVVEAHAVGTPILHSAVGSLAELAGPASVVLPEEDLGAWVEACRRCLAERAEETVPNDEARKWARRFTWDTCAARHAAVYREVAGPMPFVRQASAGG